MIVEISPRLNAARLQHVLLEARRCGLLFSESNVLAILSEAVLSGGEIEPEVQALANAIIAKATIRGRLPPRQGGRRPGVKSHDSALVTTEFFELLDGVGLVGAVGMTEDEAELELALLYDVDVSTIKRAVQSERWLHGDSKVAREQKRKSQAFDQRAEVQDDALLGLACLDEDAALGRLQAFIQPKVARTG